MNNLHSQSTVVPIEEYFYDTVTAFLHNRGIYVYSTVEVQAKGKGEEKYVVECILNQVHSYSEIKSLICNRLDKDEVPQVINSIKTYCRQAGVTFPD